MKFFFIAWQLTVNQGFLIVEALRSHTDTHYTRQDSSGKVTSPSQRTVPDIPQTLIRDRHSCPPRGIRTHVPRNRAAADPCLWPRGHCRAGFEPTFPGTERPQTHAFDLAATAARDSNPHSQEQSGRRPMPLTSRPLGPTWKMKYSKPNVSPTNFTWTTSVPKQELRYDRAEVKGLRRGIALGTISWGVKQNGKKLKGKFKKTLMWRSPLCLIFLNVCLFF